MENSMKPHVLMVTLPLLGHILPTLHLSKRLISHGFVVTFVHAKQHRKTVLQRAKDGFNNNLFVTMDTFRTAELPDPLPEQHNRSQASKVINAIISTERGVRGIMNDLSTKKPRILCIIADTLLAGIQDIANEFNVPKVDMWTCSAAFFSILLHVPRLISEGYLPLGGKEKSEPSNNISCIPGVHSLHARDLPKEFVEDESDLYFQILVKPFSRVREAYCVLANTLHEMERHCIDALIAERIPFIPIGPLLDVPSQSPIHSVVGDGPDEKQEETTAAKCLQWLGTQLPASVIYVSFGTMVFLPTYTIQEFALGLEASQQPFLWVIRQENPAVPVDDVLPEGFCLRTQGRGLIVSWAPQLSVLSHPSVGGFLTHCGWNSVLESVFMGVPMLGLPFSIDQPANLKLIADEWHIGMPLTTQEKSTSMLRVEVEKAVRELMQGAGRGEMQARATQVRDSARTSTDGSSNTNLQAFVTDMQRRALEINTS